MIKNWLRVLAWAGGTNGAVVTAGTVETGKERVRGRLPALKVSSAHVVCGAARWGVVCVLHLLLTRV